MTKSDNERKESELEKRALIYLLGFTSSLRKGIAHVLVYKYMCVYKVAKTLLEEGEACGDFIEHSRKPEV